MNRLKFLLITLILPVVIIAQNDPACDLLVIDCCSFDVTENTISLVASNYSNYLFDYPGFILFNTAMDTVAFETVNYFGIGLEQIHILDILQPVSLPFEGFLEVHTLFYDSLLCTFGVTIPDTVTTLVSNGKLQEIKIFPNPASDWLIIDFGNKELETDYNLRIINSMGQEKYCCQISSQEVQIPARSIGETGFYFVQIVNQKGQVIANQKLSLK